MTTKIAVPQYIVGKPYELFKNDILAWEAVTELHKSKQGLVLALALPDDDSCQLRSKLFDKHSVADLNKDAGLKTVIAFLDEQLGKDDLADKLIKFGEFDDYKQTTESVSDFIGKFEQFYNRMVKGGTEYSSDILAYKLIRSAKLTDTEKMLVLSGVDYTKRDTMFEQTKVSLKKFKGDSSNPMGACGSVSNTPGMAIKVEPALYNRQYGGRGNFSGFRPFRGNYATRPFKARGNSYGNQFWRGRGSDNRGTYQSFRGRGSFGSGRGASGSDAKSWRQNFGSNSPSWRGQSSGSNSQSWRSGAGEKRLNPLGTDGKPLRCDCCESIRHYVRQCPDAWENANITDTGPEMYEEQLNDLSQMWDSSNSQFDPSYYMQDEAGAYYVGENQYNEENVDSYYNENSVLHTAILYTGNDVEECMKLEAEAHNSAVVDTACTSTVCGKQWLDEYLKSLSKQDCDDVSCRNGFRTFKFGVGHAKSEAEYDIPVYLAGTRMIMRTDVVDTDVPLLFSKSFMKKNGFVIDLVNDAAIVHGKKVLLNSTSSGHYCLPLSKENDVYVVDLENVRTGDLKKTLWHLHRQFAHPIRDKFVDLLKDANSWKEEYEPVLDIIYHECNRCKEFARTPSRPVVGFSMASSFNEKVAMDLKQWGSKRWILHLIDMFSRYTISVFVTRKTGTTIIEAIINHWIGYFGVMGGIFSDNGGEFRNDEMREVASILDYELCTTAADSPYQNGLCERNHAIVDLMLSKLVTDYPKISENVLLRWANMAKNSLQMWNGFSSNQLVLGINPRLPSIMNGKIPGLNESTISEALAKHLTALHATRRAFVESESEEKLKRALRSRVRASETVYKRGDKVLYKRSHTEKWLGPARVIFQDRKCVFLDHGGYFIKASPDRMQLLPDLSDISTNSSMNDNKAKVVSKECTKAPCMFEYTNDGIVQRGLPEENDHDIDGHVDENDRQIAAVQPVNENDQQVVADQPSNANSESFTEEEDGFSNDEINTATEKWERLRIQQPVRKSLRQFNKETGASVYLSDNMFPIYMTLVPRHLHNNDECMTAKMEELEKLKKFEAYDLEPENGQQRISTRWVLSVKDDKVKARLVARGFEEEQTIQSDSPTISKCGMRMCLMIVSHQGWTMRSTDIKSAFLQSKEMTRQVYVEPPKEANNDDYVWKLKKCLYGLTDASRQFYLSVCDELFRLGVKRSSLDSSLFYMHDNKGALLGILISHIDDFLHAGNSHFEENIIGSLRKRFLAGRQDEKNFTYVGYQLKQTALGIELDQIDYIHNIDTYMVPVGRSARRNDALNNKEKTALRSQVGSLNWAVQGSRPDKAFEMIDLSTRFNCGTVADLSQACKLVRNMKDEDFTIVYPNLGKPESWRFAVFSDAAFANLKDGVSSTMAYIIFLVGENLRCCPLTWRAAKIRRVVRSTLAAETLALQESVDDVLGVRDMLCEMYPMLKLPIMCKVDNQSVVDSLHSTLPVDEKSLRINIASLKQALENEIESIAWIEKKTQLADCMTKRGSNGAGLMAILGTGILPDCYNL